MAFPPELSLMFQSTLPVWGATSPTSTTGKDPPVSIHAPRVGSDRIHKIRTSSY